MLKLNVNKEKKLTFEIQVGGVQSDQLSSHLRIEIDGIEYGFPAQIKNESVVVDLPPLRSITARSLKQGEEVGVKLDVVADGQHIVPWKDTFVLSNPLMVEAKIKDNDFQSSSTLKTVTISEGESGDEKQGVIVEEVEEKKPEVKNDSDYEAELTERIVNKLAEKLNMNLNKSKEKKTPKQNKSVKTESTKPEKPTSNKITPNDVANITQEGVLEYMERAGTKNPAIQMLIYEQAEVAAGSSKPVDVLKQVVKILKKK